MEGPIEAMKTYVGRPNPQAGGEFVAVHCVTTWSSKLGGQEV